MATDGSATVTVSQQSIDERLDAIDRLLLGLIPRSERLEFVAKLESRLCDRLATGDDAVENALQAHVDEPQLTGASAPRRSKKLSRLALSAGSLGLLSAALMFAIPIVYIGATLVASVLPEELLIVLIGCVPFAALVAGSLAVVLGIGALIRVVRRSNELLGRGWAITGICAGPMPVLVSALPLALIASQLLVSSAISVNVSPTGTISAPGQCTTCAPVGYASAPSMPSPYAASPCVAPHFCQPVSISPAPYSPEVPQPLMPPLSPAALPATAIPSVATTPPATSPLSAVAEEKPEPTSNDQPALTPDQPPEADESAK